MWCSTFKRQRGEVSFKGCKWFVLTFVGLFDLHHAHVHNGRSFVLHVHNILMAAVRACIKKQAISNGSRRQMNPVSQPLKNDCHFVALHYAAPLDRNAHEAPNTICVGNKSALRIELGSVSDTFETARGMGNILTIQKKKHWRITNRIISHNWHDY